MAITDLSSFFFHQIRTAEEEAGRIYEPVIGIVTDLQDPDKLFRVKVKIPALSTQDNTWWAPVISEGAGKDRGWYFLPELDDEVLVMFEHGDIARPLIIGALWNGKDKPHENNQSGDNPRRTFKSVKGNTIVFDDKDGKIIISDGDGKGQITIEDAKIIIEAKQGDLALQAPSGNTAIVCKDADLGANSACEVVSTQTVKLGSDAAANIKASSMMQLTSSQCMVGGGAAQAPQAPQASPAEIPDPKGG